MNNKKRGLEVAAAIITIVGASLLGIGALAFLSNPEQVVDGVVYDSSGLEVIMFLMLCAAITMIILASILCTNPFKNGVYNPRFGTSITLLVFLGLFAVLEIQEFLYFVLFATPFGLLLGSVCMKTPTLITPQKNLSEPDAATTAKENTNDNETINSEEVHIIENNYSVLGIEEQLRKLKELKDLGVLDEEQYKNAVEKILSKL